MMTMDKNTLCYCILTLQYHCVTEYLLDITIIRWNLSHLKRSGKKHMKKRKNLGRCRESNPGPLAPATSGLTTELPRPSHFFFILLSSSACCSLILNRPPIMCRQSTFFRRGAIICGLKRLSSQLSSSDPSYKLDKNFPT